jgi:hypothetical protein
MDGVEKPRTIDVYVQAWHNQIWEPGFMGMFKGKDSYNKTKAFKDLSCTYTSCQDNIVLTGESA